MYGVELLGMEFNATLSQPSDTVEEVSPYDAESSRLSSEPLSPMPNVTSPDSADQGDQYFARILDDVLKDNYTIVSGPKYVTS